MSERADAGASGRPSGEGADATQGRLDPRRRRADTPREAAGARRDPGRNPARASRLAFAGILALTALLAGPRALAAGPERLVGGSCGDCDAALGFDRAALSSRARLADEREPGEPLTILGSVRDAEGKPVAGVVVYAHQTDAAGRYTASAAGERTSGHEHGALRAWVRSDANGRFRFDTVRPGHYPGTVLPRHVHMHVVEPGRCYYAIDDMVFDDDPHLRSPWLERIVQGRGGSGRVMPRRTAEGWQVERTIVLGRNIEGYAACDGPAPRR